MQLVLTKMILIFIGLVVGCAPILFSIGWRLIALFCSCYVLYYFGGEFVAALKIALQTWVCKV